MLLHGNLSSLLLPLLLVSTLNAVRFIAFSFGSMVAAVESVWQQ
jgi:hypothetical protein